MLTVCLTPRKVYACNFFPVNSKSSSSRDAVSASCFVTWKLLVGIGHSFFITSKRSCWRCFISVSVHWSQFFTKSFKRKALSLKPFSMFFFSIKERLLYCELYPVSVRFAIVCRYCWCMRSQSSPNDFFHFSDNVWGIICSIVIVFSVNSLTISWLSLLSLFSIRSKINIRWFVGILYIWRVAKFAATSSSEGKIEAPTFLSKTYANMSGYSEVSLFSVVLR